MHKEQYIACCVQYELVLVSSGLLSSAHIQKREFTHADILRVEANFSQALFLIDSREESVV